jgi:hypothetical protein
MRHALLGGGGQDAPQEHESAVNETDKSLLAELIPAPLPTNTSPNPPNGSANPNGNGNGSAQHASNGIAAAAAATAARTIPAVNCMNTPDCHWLPDELLQYAQEQGIELWAGGAGESCGTSPSTLTRYNDHRLLISFGFLDSRR